MTGHNEHGGGEASIRREIIEAQEAEDRRAARALTKWRRVIEALRKDDDGPQ